MTVICISEVLVFINDYLACGNYVLQGMNAQTQYIISMFSVKTLRMLCLVVYDTNCGNMIDNIPSLCVKYVVSAVIATIPEQRKVNCLRHSNSPSGDRNTVFYTNKIFTRVQIPI